MKEITTYTTTFRFGAGFGIRTAMINSLKYCLDSEGWDYDLREYGGWFASEYLVKVRGEDKSKLDDLAQRLKDWMINNGGGWG